MKQSKPIAARLVLADGTTYSGWSFGAEVNQAGEVVFNTGMVGYPESLTDPSYRGQILTYTYPLIGNYGVPPAEQWESTQPHVQGVIVQAYQDQWSHWQAEQSLAQWLQLYGIPAITGIDTRALTQHLRTQGVMLGQIVVGTNRPLKTLVDPNTTNLVAAVSCTEPQWFGRGKKKIILVDCGVKLNIIREFVQRGIRVKRVPWDYDYRAELPDYDGVFVSNGPGDPTRCTPTIEYLKAVFRAGKPQFGICLGSQIQSLAIGAKTYKLKFGHRAQNQPCVIEGTKQVMLTSQNHGFAVAEKTLPRFWKVWFRNANDHSVEGIKHLSKPWYSVQFHPEANPGPTDANTLFDQFISDL